MPTRGQSDVWQASLDALPLSFKRKACHYYPDIPTVRLGSLNHGAGGVGALKVGGDQYKMTKKNMEALMPKCDVVLAQEVKCWTNSYLNEFPNFKGYGTRPQRNEGRQEGKRREKWKAGGIIWLRRSFLKNFEARFQLVG